MDNTAVLLAYTVAGDANLDRSVGFADLVVLAQNYNGIGKTFNGIDAGPSNNNIITGNIIANGLAGVYLNATTHNSIVGGDLAPGLSVVPTANNAATFGVNAGAAITFSADPASTVADDVTVVVSPSGGGAASLAVAANVTLNSLDIRTGDVVRLADTPDTLRRRSNPHWQRSA